MNPIDQHNVAALAGLFTNALISESERLGRDRARIFEGLNALAFVAASIIAGTGEPKLRVWFNMAVTQALADLEKKDTKSVTQ
jgi:hypothetical protein